MNLQQVDTQLLPHPYTHIEQITTVHFETVKAIFTQGRCHIYALALKQANPTLTLKATYRSGELQHVYCQTIESQILDVTGTYPNVQTYMDANPLNQFLNITHKTITLKHIQNLIEYNTLLPPTDASIKLAQATAAHLKQTW